MEIRLGPAGSPAPSTLEGVSRVKELGLQAMEVQFSHGIKMNPELAKRIGKERERAGIDLSVHAPYYVNLASDEKEKREASKKRVLDSCERAHYMGASPVVFHPAYFGKKDKKDVFEITKKAIMDMMGVVKDKDWDVRLAPETTGKHSALGSLDETISLVKGTGCFLCVDMAHLYARGYGDINYREILDKLEFIKGGLHIHFSGIEYTAKGERNHTPMGSNPDFSGLAEEILRRKISCTIISESPVTWRDSLKMKEIFERLGYKF